MLYCLHRVGGARHIGAGRARRCRILVIQSSRRPRREPLSHSSVDHSEAKKQRAADLGQHRRFRFGFCPLSFFSCVSRRVGFFLCLHFCPSSQLDLPAAVALETRSEGATTLATFLQTYHPSSTYLCLPKTSGIAN